jgi:hypothetical protein
MSCPRFHERLLFLASGELAAPDAELCAHLEQCAACRAKLDSLRARLAQVEGLLASQLAAEPSPAFAARVRQRIAEEAAAAPGVGWWWRPAAITAVAALVVLGVWIGWQEWRHRDTVGDKPEIPVEVVKVPQELIPPLAKAETSGARQRGVQRAALQPRRPVVEERIEVLVPKGKMEVITQLYRASWSGQSAEPLLAAALPAVSDSGEPYRTAALQILPLKLKQLASLSEGQ